MKLRTTAISALLLPCFCFTACKKETPTAGNPADTSETGETKPSDTAPPKDELPPASASADERAAMLGIVGHLSSDTEAVLALYDGTGIVEGLASLDIWEFIREVAKSEEGFDPEEEIAEEAGELKDYLGNEIFIAIGEGAASQFQLLGELQQKLTYYQMRQMSRALAQGIIKGDIEEGMMSMEEPAWLMDFGRELGQYMDDIEKLEVPSMLVGVKITDEEKRTETINQVNGMLGMMGSEGGEPVEIEKAGSKFTGFKFKGSLAVDEIGDDREDMEEMLGKENVDKLLSALSKKAVVIAAGSKGEYIMFYVGKDEDSCPLTDDVSSSLAANDKISFIDGFKGKKVHGFFFFNEDMMEPSASGTLEYYAEGIRDGLQSVSEFAMPREIGDLMTVIVDKEGELMDMMTTNQFGGVISVDNGVKFDTFGGINTNAMDMTSTHKLAKLGDGDEVLFFADWVRNEEYSETAGELFELVAETTYALANHVARLDIESEELAEFKGMFGMFDSTFRADALSLWKGITTAGEGLDAESAVIVDLNAKFPPIPGVPDAIVNNTRFVRASFVSPVKDRAKLSESWKMVDTSIRALLEKLKDMGIEGVHMLDPTSSEKDELKTWYFDALAFSDDLKPSVTVDDEWFVASTSKTQALDIVEKAKSGAGDRTGVWAKFDIVVLTKYLKETLSALESNSEAVFPGKGERESFMESVPQIVRGIDALSEIKAITFHSRVEEGTRRATLHFEKAE